MNPLEVSPSLSFAREFAIRMHADQKYGDLPYSAHLDDVYRNLMGTSGKDDIDLQIAAYGHDLEEDVPECTRAFTRLVLGRNAEDLIYRCTGFGDTRAQRTQSIIAKLKGHPRAILLKLCDRVSNMEACARDGKGEKLMMYLKERPLYDALFATSDEQLYHRFRAF